VQFEDEGKHRIIPEVPWNESHVSVGGLLVLGYGRL
jgi:hypothetical protein